MSDVIDLSPAHRVIVDGILSEHVPECEVRAFGSRAKWTAGDYSDLDLVVVGEGPLDWMELGRLREAFEESNLPMRVDVLDWHAISDSFRRVIEGDYVVLQEGLGKGTGEWQEVTLGDCTVINDATYSPKEAWPFINYLDTGSITENRVAQIQKLEFGKHKIPSRARRKVRPGDIVYSTVRPNQKHFGLLKDAPENFLASTGFAVLRGVDGLADTDYIYWYLSQDHIVQYLQAIAETSTSAYPAIKPSDLEKLTLLLPPLAEQRAIAHVLGTLDDKIELNRRMNETLEGMARALFKSWFVDFEPVRAKMDGRWRQGESLPGLPADLYDAFPERLVASELGEAPEGWHVRQLGEVVEIHDKKRVPLNSRQRASRKGSYPYYGAAGIMDYVDDFLFEGVHVLTGEDGSVVDENGYPVVQYVWGQFWVNNHAHVLTATNGISNEHLHLLLKQLNITAYVTGAVQPKLSQRNLKSIPVTLPEGLVCGAFARLIEPLYERVRDNSDEAKLLAAQRDALLPGLVGGEVRVGR